MEEDERVLVLERGGNGTQILGRETGTAGEHDHLLSLPHHLVVKSRAVVRLERLTVQRSRDRDGKEESEDQSQTHPRRITRRQAASRVRCAARRPARTPSPR